ncbi:MAG: metallophosphoesterase [Planctomycetota bacterium]|nr:MAG: metallophosphoesterase [Planctomycetota bacterium]
MKLLIVSDLHSNRENLEAVLDAEADADRVYCAGDVVDVGFDPCGVIDILRERSIPCVMGNHDEKIIRLWQEGVDRQRPPKNFPEHNAQLLDAERIAYLRALPDRLTFSHDGVSYLMTHLYEGYEVLRSDYDFDAFWADAAVDPEASHRCIILGHTHHQAVTWLAADRCWINPGSIGYNRPQDPFPGTRYMTIVDGTPHFHRLEHPAWRSRPALREEFAQRYPQPAK